MRVEVGQVRIGPPSGAAAGIPECSVNEALGAVGWFICRTSVPSHGRVPRSRLEMMTGSDIEARFSTIVGVARGAYLHA